jgi:membrane associated rhomboid family serine protease
VFRTQGARSFWSGIGPAVKSLFVLQVVLFFAARFAPSVLASWIVSPLVLRPGIWHSWELWRLVTYSLVHTSVWGLLWSLSFLLSVGRNLERIWGTKFFILYGVICALSGALSLTAFQGDHVAAAGGDAVTAGLLAALHLIDPSVRLGLFFLGNMPAWGLIALLIVLNMIDGGRQGVLLILGGAAGGWLFLKARVWRLTARQIAGSWSTMKDNAAERWNRRTQIKEAKDQALLGLEVDRILEKVSRRSEERRVGKECRRLCRSRWSPYH